MEANPNADVRAVWKSLIRVREDGATACLKGHSLRHARLYRRAERALAAKGRTETAADPTGYICGTRCDAPHHGCIGEPGTEQSSRFDADHRDRHAIRGAPPYACQGPQCRYGGTVGDPPLSMARGDRTAPPPRVPDQTTRDLHGPRRRCTGGVRTGERGFACEPPPAGDRRGRSPVRRPFFCVRVATQQGQRAAQVQHRYWSDDLKCWSERCRADRRRSGITHGTDPHADRTVGLAVDGADREQCERESDASGPGKTAHGSRNNKRRPLGRPLLESRCWTGRQVKLVASISARCRAIAVIHARTLPPRGSNRAAARWASRNVSETACSAPTGSPRMPKAIA